MKAPFLIGMFVAAAFVSGCQSVMERRIAANQVLWQQLPAYSQERLRSHIVWRGDTSAMVSIALGPPDRVLTRFPPTGEPQTIWQYATFEGPDPMPDPEPQDFRGYLRIRTTDITLVGGAVTQIKVTPPGATPPQITAAPNGAVTSQEALAYAKSVLLLQRVVKDGRIRWYVKEVWRFDHTAGPAPAIGAEYGPTAPSGLALAGEPARFPERYIIAFDFGWSHPEGLPKALRITVAEDGSVPLFMMDVAGVRQAVMTTKPKT